MLVLLMHSYCHFPVTCLSSLRLGLLVTSPPLRSTFPPYVFCEMPFPFCNSLFACFSPVRVSCLAERMQPSLPALTVPSICSNLMLIHTWPSFSTLHAVFTAFSAAAFRQKTFNDLGV